MNDRERYALTIVTLMRRRTIELELARRAEGMTYPDISAEAHRGMADGLEYAVNVIRMTDYEQAEERRSIDDVMQKFDNNGEGKL